MITFSNIYDREKYLKFEFKPSFKMKILIILLIVENLSCSRLHVSREKSIKSIITLEFVQYALEKFKQEQDIGTDDLRALIFYINQMRELEKKYKTPDVYWYTRQG